MPYKPGAGSGSVLDAALPLATEVTQGEGAALGSSKSPNSPLSIPTLEDLKLLEGLIFVSTPKQVRQFLLERPRLIDGLFSAWNAVREIFQSVLIGQKLSLQEDPEEGSRGLTLAIHTLASPEASLALLDRLDRDWLLKQPCEDVDCLTILVRPQ